MADTSPLQESALAHARTDFPRLLASMSVDEALRVIRERGIGERLIYFYVLDEEERLVGVLPTRRLLAGAADARLSELMIRRVVGLPKTATLLDACDLFVMHKFFALPVLDADRRVLGVVDISVLAEGVLDVDEKQAPDTVFETLGFHLEQMRGASPWKAFRVRFPWLLATIGSGTCAALIAGYFEETLARVIVVSLFLALVLALAEAVTVQSLTLALQALRTARPSARWFLDAARREISTGALIGLASGLIACTIAWLWRGDLRAGGVVGVSICGGLIIASASGVAVPALLHAWGRDPQIAAGPLALAVTDLLTLLLYFSLASWLL